MSEGKVTCNLECFTTSLHVLQAMDETTASSETLSTTAEPTQLSEQNGGSHLDRLLNHDAVDIRFQANSSPRQANLDTIPPVFSDVNDKEIQLQGLVFLEDAIQYRSIHHKASSHALKLYQWYHSAPIMYSVKVATFLILMLAFFETPSSLSWSSDPRRNDIRYIYIHI